MEREENGLASKHQSRFQSRCVTVSPPLLHCVPSSCVDFSAVTSVAYVRAAIKGGGASGDLNISDSNANANRHRLPSPFFPSPRLWGFRSHCVDQLAVRPVGRRGWRLVALGGERLTPPCPKQQSRDSGSVWFSSEVLAKFKKDKSNHIKCSETLKEGREGKRKQ